VRTTVTTKCNVDIISAGNGGGIADFDGPELTLAVEKEQPDELEHLLPDVSSIENQQYQP
jgi:hypothetical protein